MRRVLSYVLSILLTVVSVVTCAVLFPGKVTAAEMTYSGEGGRMLICIMRDVTDEENERRKKEEIERETVEVADRVVEKQMRIVQEIASLLGETAAETKIALQKLKETVEDD